MVADSSFPHKTERTQIKYDQLHQLILFFRYTAMTALWTTACIFFFRVTVWGIPEDRGGLSLLYVVVCSLIMFLSAIFSHYILEWDHLVTSLRYPNGRWRCHCKKCCARRRHGSISRLTPKGLHGILANCHTWTLVPAMTSFFLMLLLTDTSWIFLIVLVVLFLSGEIAFFLLSKSTVSACRASLNEPLFMPEAFPIQQAKEPVFYGQTLPFGAIMAGIRQGEPGIAEQLENPMFSMTRSISADGTRQRIDGWVKAVFSPNQMQVTHNIPFTPPFDKLPKVSLEPESEMDVMLEPPVVMLHGMRFDVRCRQHDSDVDNSVIVHFVVESDAE